MLDIYTRLLIYVIRYMYSRIFIYLYMCLFVSNYFTDTHTQATTFL